VLQSDHGEVDARLHAAKEGGGRLFGQRCIMAFEGNVVVPFFNVIGNVIESKISEKKTI